MPIPQYYSQVVLWLKIGETDTTRLYLGFPNGGLEDHCHRTTLFFREFALTQKLWISVVIRLVCKRVKQESCFSGYALYSEFFPVFQRRDTELGSGISLP